MDQPVECKAEDIQAPPGDDDVCGMSMITIETASVNSSVDDLDDYMVDVDNVNADSEEEADEKKDSADIQPPVLDATEETLAEENVPTLSENFCISELDSKEVTNDLSGCDATAPSADSAEENSVGDKDIPSSPVKESSDKCDNGKDVTSENTTALESGKIAV